MTHRVLLAVRHCAALLRVLLCRRNMAKGNRWHLNSYHHLHNRFREEVREMEAELWACEQGTGSVARLEAEAADCSAYLAMIVEKARRQEVRR